MNNNLKAPQDDCWDINCPVDFTKSIDAIRKEKLQCFNDKREDICKCCEDMPDCKILIPGMGLVDACSDTVVESYSSNILNPKTTNGKIEIVILILVLIFLGILAYELLKKKRRR